MSRMNQVSRFLPWKRRYTFSFCAGGFCGRVVSAQSVRHFRKPNQSQTARMEGSTSKFRMNLQKTVAIAGLVLSVISSAALAAEPSTPAASVALPATTATPVAPPATPSKIKATKKRFLLTHSLQYMKSQTRLAQLLDTCAMGRTLMSLESPVIGSKLSCRAVKSDSYPQARTSDARTFHTYSPYRQESPDRYLGIVRKQQPVSLSCSTEALICKRSYTY